ncbi:MAG: 1-deoxy-D-xylulose-5-phosphate synthase [Candidatus Eremiobacteraeota bacterium]|nr:1-deoxy-D-xylulose-5-phosphate synthase [Candidatus Eremiobacteraeota bacterium]
MYIEDKSAGLVGTARIGRVRFSKRGRTLHYGELSFQSLSGRGFKANYFCVETGDHYWISGPRRDGADGLYGYRPTAIDDDVREEYWTLIRQEPSRVNERTT